MREQQNVSKMTDREYRAYKRVLRHRRILRKRVMTILATVCLVLIASISYHAINSSANTKDSLVEYKYYTNITVGYGESLWDISDDYIDYNHYKDKNAYIKEVCSINHLSDDADILAGQGLIVPYYSEVFVQ